MTPNLTPEEMSAGLDREIGQLFALYPNAMNWEEIAKTYRKYKEPALVAWKKDRAALASELARREAADKAYEAVAHALLMVLCRCSRAPDDDVPLTTVPSTHDFSCPYRAKMQPALVARTEENAGILTEKVPPIQKPTSQVLDGIAAILCGWAAVIDMFAVAWAVQNAETAFELQMPDRAMAIAIVSSEIIGLIVAFSACVYFMARLVRSLP